MENQTVIPSPKTTESFSQDTDEEILLFSGECIFDTDEMGRTTPSFKVYYKHPWLPSIPLSDLKI